MPRHYTDADLAAKLRAQGLPVTFKYRANRKPREGPSESQIQIATVAWWRQACAGFGVPEHLLFSVPNGGWRDPKGMHFLKLEGLRPGVCDIFLSVARGPYHGLYLEFKTAVGKVRSAQADFMADAGSEGYATYIPRSSEDAIKTISDYLQCRL